MSMRPLTRLLQAGDKPGKAALAVAGNAGNADDLAASQREV